MSSENQVLGLFAPYFVQVTVAEILAILLRLANFVTRFQKIGLLILLKLLQHVLGM